MKLIHYGSNRFEKDKFKPIRNPQQYFNKPCGGLWTCPINLEWGWKEFGEQIGRSNMDKSFELILDSDKILEIYSEYSAQDLPMIEFDTPDFYSHNQTLDFEALAKEYDALHMPEFAMESTDDLPYEFYGWDVETVLIFNPDVIKLHHEIY